MAESDTNEASNLSDAPNLLLIVVGAHLRAETADRPLAYRLAERIRAWVEKHGRSLNAPPVPVVCCDVWYINDESLHHRPTISIGGPGVNALSAYFHDKLKTAAQRQDQYVLQFDPDFVDLRASIWGMDHKLTVQALNRFVEKHLSDFVRAAATQVEPLAE